MNFKEFIKYVLVVTLSTIMTLGTLLFLFYISVLGLALSLKNTDLSGEKDAKIIPGTIMELRLDYPIKEYNDSPFENFDPKTFKFKPALTLHQIAETIKMAAYDSNIEAILIHAGMINGGLADVEEIQKALKDFKKSGKKVFSFSEFYSQKSFFLSGVADEMFIHPSGIFEWKGLASQIMFFKDLLSRLDINVQVIRHGKFKSAVEPYVNNQMSEENRMQIRTLLDDFWKFIKFEIYDNRGISYHLLDKAANDLTYVTPEDWQDAGFFDEILSREGLRKKLLDQLELDNIHFISETDYYYKNQIKKFLNKDFNRPKIAVLLAEGEIVDGEGEKNQIGSDRFVRLIRKIKDDDQIKAVVLRINSPGGSALASEIIWKELELLKKVKPLVVSMGNMAASGGYYIASAGEKIYANYSTITGSIGVFGLIPDISGLMKNKLHINIDTVKTNPHADMGILRPLDEKEKAYMQKFVEFTYRTFLKRVAQGRKMSVEKVDSIGQGRVWSGFRAEELGLVDEIGTLDDAVAYVAKEAELENYKLVYYPKTDNPFIGLFNMQNEMENKILKRAGEVFGIQIPVNLKQYFLPGNRIQARLPFQLKLID